MLCFSSYEDWCVYVEPIVLIKQEAEDDWTGNDGG